MQGRPGKPPLRSCLFRLNEAAHFVPWRLGRGDFLLGARMIAGIARGRPIVVDGHGRIVPKLFTDGIAREYVEVVDAADAALFAKLGGQVGPGLVVAIALAWDHLAPERRSDLYERLQRREHMTPHREPTLSEDGARYEGAVPPGYQTRIESFEAKPRRGRARMRHGE